MRKPKIFRKRFIPFETVDITSDELLYRDADIIITRWNTIKPRKDIAQGLSFTFLNDGIKISKFFDGTGKFLYWYCDIIEIQYDSSEDAYLLIDLLVDVKVLPDGSVRVLDTDELAEAMEQGLVTGNQVCRALRMVDKLLKTIYNGSFPPSVCMDQSYQPVTKL